MNNKIPPELREALEPSFAEATDPTQLETYGRRCMVAALRWAANHSAYLEDLPCWTDYDEVIAGLDHEAQS